MNSLFQNITHALGWSIVHSIWQGLLLYSLLCLFYVAFPKLNARKKYAMAFSAQLAVFIAFLSTFYHYLDFSQTDRVVVLSDIPAGNMVYTETATPMLQVLEPMFPWFASLYIIGLFVQLILFTNSLSKLRYLKTTGLQDAPSLWQESFQKIKTKLRLPGDIQFFLSEKVSVPLTLGHLKPIILFPVALVNNLDLKQVESILIHELAHIKRHDYLLNLLKVIIETTLFFNPFTWLLSRHIAAEREHACDDIVVKWVASPIAYAQALMSVEINSHQAAPAYAMAATGKNYHLLHRIQRITKMEKKNMYVKQHLLALSLGSLALVAIAWIAPADKKEIATVDTAQHIIDNVDTISKEHVFVPAVAARIAQDSSKKAKMASIVHQTKDSVCIIAAPAAPIAEAHIIELSKNAARIQEQFNTPQWKKHIANVEANAKKIEEYYNSPEWKAHIAKIEEQSIRQAEAYYDSPKWKAHIAKIEENAKRVEEYYNSKEWKAQIAKIEENARKVEAYYDSPEWKAQIATIEESAKKVEAYYNSPEWKNQLSKIEENAKKIAEYYDSAAWKEKVEQQMKEKKVQAKDN